MFYCDSSRLSGCLARILVTKRGGVTCWETLQTSHRYTVYKAHILIFEFETLFRVALGCRDFSLQPTPTTDG